MGPRRYGQRLQRLVLSTETSANGVSLRRETLGKIVCGGGSQLVICADCDVRRIRKANARGDSPESYHGWLSCAID